MKASKRIGLILLAAGGSRRFGAPKQLHKLEGESLLRRAAVAGIASKCTTVVAVLGAAADRLRSELDGLEVEIAINTDWEEGMSGSIRTGLKKLLEADPDVGAAVITVCDQPKVSAAVIDRLTAAFRRSGAPVVASEYARTLGVPAAFGRELFHELFELTGDRGAKTLIRRYRDRAVPVSFPGGEIDIDTAEDLAAFDAKT